MRNKANFNKTGFADSIFSMYLFGRQRFYEQAEKQKPELKVYWFYAL